MNRILPAALALASALLLTACDGGLTVNEETCSAANISAVADKEGLDKAKALSKACLEKGYGNALESLNKAGKALNESIQDAGKALGDKLFKKE